MSIGSAVPRPLAGEMMESLYQHRLLSTAQLQEIHAPDKSSQWTRRVLRELLDEGHVAFAKARVRQRGEPMRLWYLTDRGADSVERGPRAEDRRVVVSDAGAAGQLQAHTLAVNDVGIAFMRAARAREEDDCGYLSWRHEATHEIAAGRGRARGDRLQADAVLEYQLADEDGVAISYRFLELDRGTMPLANVAAKFGNYAQLASYAPDEGIPLWRRHYPTLPAVLVVLDHDSRRAAERRLDALVSLAEGDPAVMGSEIKFLFGLLEDLEREGPFARMWDLPGVDDQVDWLGRPA